ncbi:MAG: transposase [Planctomycetaceae bacterium]|nr:transposase [Planctomycetaceae bacterium]
MFKIIVLKFQYNLSDEMTEFFIRDRKTFQDFLGITPYHTIPDAKTIFGKLINTVPNDEERSYRRIPLRQVPRNARIERH